MQSADVIIALGARFDDRVTGNLKSKYGRGPSSILTYCTGFAPEAVLAAKEGRGGVIHFGMHCVRTSILRVRSLFYTDILPRNINKVVQATEPVLGDINHTLPQLLKHMQFSARTEWFESINQ